jgi:hypothetical protein
MGMGMGRYEWEGGGLSERDGGSGRLGPQDADMGEY